MPYGSIVGPGSTLAATGLATGQVWMVVISVVSVLVGTVMVRSSFRRGKGPAER
ncbi:hypothetical protein AB0E77_14420 [Streptomyces sp. NPDC032940]|uniref:hypothetical protein n=1 Tax=Streptomyces sp. NPDC032940 TaxID=3155366 RepID=UPI0033FF7791